MPKNPEFEFHRMNKAGIDRATTVADAFDQLLDTLIQCGVDSSPRYLAIVKTKLEEACFFAKKGVAQQKVNQDNSPPPSS